MNDKKPDSGYVRVRRHKKKLIEAGGRRMDLHLTPEANKAAQQLIDDGVASSATALINQLLIAESARRQDG